jgi:hypothetical protein
MAMVVDYSNTAFRIVFRLIEWNGDGQHRCPNERVGIIVANKARFIKKPVAVCNIKKIPGHWLMSALAVAREASRLSQAISSGQVDRNLCSETLFGGIPLPALTSCPFGIAGRRAGRVGFVA